MRPQILSLDRIGVLCYVVITQETSEKQVKMKTRRKVMKRKVLSLLLAASMVVTMAGCGNSGNNDSNSTASESTSSEVASSESTSVVEETTDEVVKPESIRVVMNGTVVTQDNGLADFETQLEDVIGLDINFDPQDHAGYADAVGRIFASGDWPDVILLSAEQYTAYATEGVLWDMTEAYENASFQDTLTSAVNENLKIDGKLFGLAPTRGNGCVTYVKQAWLDAVGITETPTTWDEYYDMLVKFTTMDPDGNGVNDTYGVSAAGIVGTEAPYTNYLPEFYQDAYPDFLQDASGVWYDGFDTDAMAGALTRLQQGYQDKVIDPETLTQSTKDARNKYYADQFGAFTYWAGTWNRNIISNLEAQELPSDIVVLNAIDEIGNYTERQAAVWAITTACENPEGVFKYFLETMLDGGEAQFLWTYGAKGTHWDNIEEEFTVGTGDEAKTYTYAEGEFHMLPSPEKPDTIMTKNHLDNMLVISPMSSEYTVAEADEIVEACNQFFIDNSVLAPMLPSSELLNSYNGDLWDIKNKVITEVVVNGGDVAQWMQYYKDQAGAMSAEVVAELNS